MDQTFTELVCHRNRDSGKPEPDVIVPDAKTIKEIRGLSRTPTGAFKAKSGHEDHYDALCIALCIARDSFSGLHRQKEVKEEAQRNEFEARFAAINTPLGANRNHPSLANL